MCHNFIQMLYCPSAVVSLAYGLEGLLVILGDGQYFFVDIGQTILTTERTPNAAPAEKRDGGSSRSS
jgi:hypothetical protein